MEHFCDKIGSDGIMFRELSPRQDIDMADY